MKEKSLQLQSLFNLIKAAAEKHQSAAEGETEIFLWDLVNIAEIGSSTAFSLWQEIEESPQTEESEFETLTLAEQISLILKNPDLPPPIYDGLQDGITDATTVTDADSEQPEYIERVIQSYRHKTEAKGDE